MSLGVALNNAISGLRLNQAALSVLSNNLANANTDGYSRKVMTQTALYIEGQGSGVEIGDVVRKVDNYLQRSMQTQGSETQRFSTISDYYDRMQVLLGEPGAQNSIDEYMTSFMNSLTQLSDQPERTSYRSNLVNAASQLAGQVSDLAYQMQSLRFEADKDIVASVGTVNGALKKLYDLNVAIGRASGIGQSTAGLLDERDLALKSLSEQMDVDIFYEPNGVVTVTGGNGIPLVDGIQHQLKYAPSSSVESMVNDQQLNALQVVSVASDGSEVGQPSILVTSGKSATITSQMSGGKLQGLVELRDELIPDVLDQLDMIASRLRDSMNAIHNDGSGFPPANSLTGERLIDPNKEYDWRGSVRIAVLNADGTPVQSPYASESYTGIRPLTLDLSALQSSGDSGRFNMATVINEINNQFSAPGVKTTLGSVNNIQLVSDSTQIPAGASTQFKFDLDLDNIADDKASVFVQNIAVKDSNGVDMTNVLQDVPHLDVDPLNTYTTYSGQSTVDVHLMSAEGLKAGDVVYLGSPSTATVNNIPSGGLTGYFIIQHITGSTISIEASNGSANLSGSVADAGTVASAAYQTVQGGEKVRSLANGPMEVDLSSNITSLYYDVTLDVASIDADGRATTSQITYRVQNNQTGMNGRRFDSTAATNDAVREAPTTTQAVMKAMLVDADGHEIAQVNGEYPANTKGYLKLVGTTSNYTIAIDEMDSKQMGDTTQPGLVPPTNQGFSSYFGLNNFFASNKLVEGGDTVKNSAINLRVEQRIIDNPNLVSTGDLVVQKQTAGENPQYTYLRYAGDNGVAQRMANLSSQVVSFEAAGGMPKTDLSLQSYASEMLGYLGSLSAGAKDNLDNAQTLYDGFSSRAKSASGVNIDEELANTVVFQNAYAATARIVSVVDEMFKTLIDAT